MLILVLLKMKKDIHKQAHGLWVSGALSPLEWLTIRSFLKQGYHFTLWTYQQDGYNLPEGAVCRDASEIIAKRDVFQYEKLNQFGHGMGSFAGFSDIFRYRLLFLKGGWWTDMDVCCLKPLPDTEDYVFRNMKTGKKAVGNLMFAFPGTAMMDWCATEAARLINSENTNWLLPLHILNDGIVKFGLQNHIRSFTNPDSWPLMSKYLRKEMPLRNWHAIHWMNEEFRRIGLPKDAFIEGSTLQQLMKAHEIPHSILKAEEKKEYLRLTGLIHYISINLKYLPFWMLRR